MIVPESDILTPAPVIHGIINIISKSVISKQCRSNAIIPAFNWTAANNTDSMAVPTRIFCLSAFISARGHVTMVQLREPFAKNVVASVWPARFVRAARPHKLGFAVERIRTVI